jgi:hypothetical protein
MQCGLTPELTLREESKQASKQVNENQINSLGVECVGGFVVEFFKATNRFYICHMAKIPITLFKNKAQFKRSTASSLSTYLFIIKLCISDSEI